MDDTTLPQATMERMRMRIMDEMFNQPQNPDRSATRTSPLSSSAAPSSNLEANGQPSTMSVPNPSLISSADWTEEGLVKSSENFEAVHRISANESPETVLATIKEYEFRGEPLVIEKWHEHPQWNAQLFTMEGFVGDGQQIVDARNVRTAEDVKMPLRELVQNYQVVSKRAEPGETQRFYGKDIECPPEWSKWLETGALPPYIHPFGKDDMFSHLPADVRPETLMCYLGIGDTFTPAHKDLCGSFGHNIMCHTADGGSAFWFMTATGLLHQDNPATYFHEKLGEELDLESHTATVAELRDAPFKVYITGQRLGDLVLVPPRSCHQVVNRGGVTIKMSWSRMGLKSFELSLYDELPLYHRVCRPEVYRVKLNIFHAVETYGRLLSDSATPPPLDQRLPLSSCRDSGVHGPDQTMDETPPSSSLFMETKSVLKSLLRLLDDILIQEWDPNHMHMLHLKDHREMHTCGFCGADIFQSFFKCGVCTGGENDGSEFICCAACYVEGRSCACQGSQMEPFQTRPFDDLIRARNAAAKALNAQDSSCSSRTLNISSSAHLFEAACKLRQHKIDRTKQLHRKTHLRCTVTRSGTVPAHKAPVTHVLNCGHCHSSICFQHILDHHGVYASDAILAHAKDDDQTAWHERHTKTPRRKAPLSEHRRLGSGVDIVKRMAWAASIFRRCRPLDAVRAKSGYYDDGGESGEEEGGATQAAEKVAGTTGVADEVVGTKRTADETSNPSTLSNVSADIQNQSLDLRFDSPLTELSDSDADQDCSSESGSSCSAPSSRPLTRTRRHMRANPSKNTSTSSVQRRRATVKPAAVTVKPAAVTVKRVAVTVKPAAVTFKPAAVNAIKRSGPRQNLAFVLVPPTPKKRPVAHDSAVSTTPAKKARVVVLAETPVADTSSPSSSKSPGVRLNSTASVAPPTSAFRQRTLVPMKPNPRFTVRPAENHSPSQQTAASPTRAGPSSDAILCKLPVGALVGRPLGNDTHLKHLKFRKSRNNRPSVVPAAPSTLKSNLSVPSTTGTNQTKASSETSRDQQDEPVFQNKNLSVPSTAGKNQTKASSETSRDQRDEPAVVQSRNLSVPSTAGKNQTKASSETSRDQRDERIFQNIKSRVEASLAEAPALKKQGITTMKIDISFDQASEGNVDLNKLKKGLEESQRLVEEKKREADQLSDKNSRLQQELDESVGKCKSLQLQLEKAQTSLSERDRSLNGVTSFMGMLGEGFGAAIGRNVHSGQSFPGQPYGILQAVPPMQVVARRGSVGMTGWQRHRGSFNNQSRTSAHRNKSTGDPYHSHNHPYNHFHKRREDDYPRTQSTRLSPPRHPKAMTSRRSISYEHAPPNEESTSYRDERPELHTNYASNRENTSYPATHRHEDANSHSRHFTEYRPRDCATSRSRSPSRAITPPRMTPPRMTPPRTTPPRMAYSRSPSRRGGHEGVRDLSPDTRRFSEAPRASYSSNLPIQEPEDRPMDLDYNTQDDDRQYRREQPTRQEPEEDNDGGYRPSRWEENR